MPGCSSHAKLQTAGSPNEEDEEEGEMAMGDKEVEEAGGEEGDRGERGKREDDLIGDGLRTTKTKDRPLEAAA